MKEGSDGVETTQDSNKDKHCSGGSNPISLPINHETSQLAKVVSSTPSRGVVGARLVAQMIELVTTSITGEKRLTPMTTMETTLVEMGVELVVTAVTAELFDHQGMDHWKCNEDNRSLKMNSAVDVAVAGLKKKFVCGVCKHRFVRKRNLQIHARTHTGEEKQFVCKVCHKRFIRRQNLKRHIRHHTRNDERTHKGEKQFVCEVCHKRFNWSQSLKRHMRLHMREGKPLNHQELDHRKSNKDDKSSNMDPAVHVALAGRNIFVSGVCNRWFDRKDKLQNHERAHTGERSYECQECHERFILKQHLKRHICLHIRETTNKIFVCKDDGTNFVANAAVAGRKKIFVCGVCNHCFGGKNSLMIHERIHTGEKPYECQECHKRFIQKGNLKRHEGVHMKERLYHCTYCAEQFVREVTMRRHLQLHTGEQSYACEMCTLRFSNFKHLTRHRKIHKGEKSFEHPECLSSASNPVTVGDDVHILPLSSPQAARLIVAPSHRKSTRKPSSTIRIPTSPKRGPFFWGQDNIHTQTIDMSLSHTLKERLMAFTRSSSQSRYSPSMENTFFELSVCLSSASNPVTVGDDAHILPLSLHRAAHSFAASSPGKSTRKPSSAIHIPTSLERGSFFGGQDNIHTQAINMSLSRTQKERLMAFTRPPSHSRYSSSMDNTFFEHPECLSSASNPVTVGGDAHIFPVSPPQVAYSIAAPSRGMSTRKPSSAICIPTSLKRGPFFGGQDNLQTQAIDMSLTHTLKERLMAFTRSPSQFRYSPTMDGALNLNKSWGDNDVTEPMEVDVECILGDDNEDKVMDNIFENDDDLGEGPRQRTTQY